MTDSTNLPDALDAEYAEAWKPEPGEKIIGVVTDISERDGTFGRYPIVTLRTEAGERAIHAFHEVLANELARVAPKVGDELGVRYSGKHEDRGYHRYRVRRAGESAEVDWTRYGGDAGPGAPSDEDAVSAASDERERDELDAVVSSVHTPLPNDATPFD